MRNEYSKPNIEINHWIVSSLDIQKLYEFFVRRFPESNVEILLESQEGHTRICESFDEYSKEVSLILSNNDIISNVKISVREGESLFELDRYKYKQIGINISFEYSSTTIYVIGGDTDGSCKDWIEGAYTELLGLKKIFEITDDKVIEVLDKKYNKIIFDPNGETRKKIIESLKSIDKKLTTKSQPSKGKWFNLIKIITNHPLVTTIISGIIIAGIVYFLGWN